MSGRRLKVHAAELAHFARMGSRLVNRTGRGPELLVFFANSRCDSRCSHCFDWQRRGGAVERRDLTLPEVRQIARKLPRPYFLIVTGGEPYLRADLDEVVLAFAQHARPRVLATPTSGSRPDEVLATVGRILPRLPDEVLLSVNVSLDGPRELHDRIRGVAGRFDTAVATLRGLQELARRHSNLGVGVVSVVSRENQDHLEELAHTVLDELGVSVWNPFLVRGAPRDPRALEVDIDRYAGLARLLERRALDRTYRQYRGFLGARVNNAKNLLRLSIIERTVREGRRVVPCVAGRLAGTIYADGSVHPCEIVSRPMGNLRDHHYDLARLWRSAEAERARAAVDCADCACTHENVLTTGVAFDWRVWPWLLAEAMLPGLRELSWK